MELKTPIVRRSGQARKQPEYYSPLDLHLAIVLSAIEDDLRIVMEAIESTKSELWKKAMEEEMESLRNNYT